MLEAAISGERTLSGPEKAAALLLMMGRPPAARLLKQFDQPDLQAVARAAAGLGAIPATTLDRLVDEFATDFSAGADLFSDAGQVKSLLADSLPPEQIADILGVESGKPGKSIYGGRLAQAPESRDHCVADGGARDDCDLYPLQARFCVATKAIAALPRDRRNAALCGLVAPLAVTPLAARLIEEAVGSAMKQTPKTAAGADGRSRLAGIINGLDAPEAEDAMRALEQASPKDAAIVKGMLFSFNDLPRLSERARALLFDRASIDIVVMALRGTDAEFRDTVLSSMPSRGRRLVEGELSSGGNAPPRDIAKARKAIADIVLGMASRNEIELGGPPAEAA